MAIDNKVNNETITATGVANRIMTSLMQMT